MIQSFVTQCPHCRTSFRVSLTQLNAAHGAVRCGACLHVFNAAQQLRQQGQSIPAPAPAVPNPSPAPAKPAPAAPPPPAPVQAAATAAARVNTKGNETLWIHDDLDLDSLDLDEELAKLDAQEQLRSQQPPAPVPSPAAAQAPAVAVPSPAPGPSSTLSTDTSASEASASAEQAEQPISASAPRAIDTDTETEPSFSALDPLDQHEQSEPALDADEPLTHQHATIPEPEPEPEPAAAASTSRDEPKLGNDYRLDLHDEPLQLDWQPAKSNWPRRLGWLSLNLLAALALASQYVWYHFDELARQDQYRPWFEQLCPSLGCTLPSKVDISQIKSSNLVVRSHPEFSGALVVDAILYNRAPFSQPFPLLEMRFADINGQLLASRRFKPSEYLAGELAGNKEMPPQTPIHIALDILDPGTQAVNYSLSFHSPD